MANNTNSDQTTPQEHSDTDVGCLLRPIGPNIFDFISLKHPILCYLFHSISPMAIHKIKLSIVEFWVIVLKWFKWKKKNFVAACNCR